MSYIVHEFAHPTPPLARVNGLHHPTPCNVTVLRLCWRMTGHVSAQVTETWSRKARPHHWQFLWPLVLVSCNTPGTAGRNGGPNPHAATLLKHPSELRLPLERISIVGGSVSVGVGGTPFGEAFAAAAFGSIVTSHADLFFFRDVFGSSTAQIDAAISDAPTTLVAIDFLFWDIYSQRDPAWRDRALASGLANLERARAAGSWIVVGDVPRAISSTEIVPAASLVAADGLHANALGVWFLLDTLNHLIEQRLPGTPEDALVFVRPR